MTDYRYQYLLTDQEKGRVYYTVAKGSLRNLYFMVLSPSGNTFHMKTTCLAGHPIDDVYYFSPEVEPPPNRIKKPLAVKLRSHLIGAQKDDQRVLERGFRV